MRARVLALGGLLLLWPPAALAGDLSTPGSLRGWSYLIRKLGADGVDPARVERVFADPRLPPFTGLDFSLGGRESHALYRGFLRPASLAAARRCRAEHAGLLTDAEREHGVPASVVAAILHVETNCGRNTGSSMVFYRLARLAMANEPVNLRANVARLADPRSPGIATQVEARARRLEDMFYPEVYATFEVADRLGVDPLDLRGSSSGAMGMPQFLPTSYLRFGVDGGGDGRVDLYDPTDAAASCARYLAAHGWHPGLSLAERRAVIWRYNHSDAYIDTVLAVAREIAAPAGREAPVRRVAKPGARGKKPAARTTQRGGRPASAPKAAAGG